MPELPDVTVYIEALESRIVGQQLERIRLASPFLLRSVFPPLSALHGRPVEDVRRIGKQIVVNFGDELFLVIHLMIAGRFQWKARGAKLSGKTALAAFDFTSGTLILTEAGSKKRASLHAVEGEDLLRSFNRGGLEPLDCTLEEFRRALLTESHTLKRTLTDPRLFSGIGNAYSDEILHHARLSLLKLTKNLSDEEIALLHAATKEVLKEWIERLRSEAGDEFPTKVTAFRPEMAVHGRFGRPCPVCGHSVQRIVYAENEANYCATCQTGGRLLADRALSRLLREDWPRSLDDWEAHKEARREN